MLFSRGVGKGWLDYVHLYGRFDEHLYYQIFLLCLTIFLLCLAMFEQQMLASYLFVESFVPYYVS